jgi:hypothetical protein
MSATAKCSVGARLVLLMGLMLLPGGAGTAHAQVGLRPEFGQVAKDIKLVLKELQEETIAVGTFTAPARLSSSAGPGIAKVLIEELQRQSIKVDRKAKLEVKGEYRDFSDAKSRRTGAQLLFRIEDSSSGKRLREFERQTFDAGTIAALFGLSLELSTEGFENNNKSLQNAIKQPTVVVRDTRIAAAPQSPFSMEILVRGADGSFRPRTPRVEDGQAFVEIKRGEVYQVRINNDAPFDAGVTLSIDGLSAFAFSEVKDKAGRPAYHHYIVPKSNNAILKGWHIDDAHVDEFEIKSFAKSAAAEKNLLPGAEGIGTITVTFAAAWLPNAKPPADEPAVPTAAPPVDAEATGRGQRIEEKVTAQQRNFGALRAAISVRYTK